MVKRRLRLKQPAHADVAVAPARHLHARAVQVPVDVQPLRPRADFCHRAVLIERHGCQARHVDGHAVLRVGEARGRSVAASLDGEVAVVDGTDDGYRRGDILRGCGLQDAGGLDAGFLYRPVASQGVGVASGIRELDSLSEALSKIITLSFLF